MKNRKIDFDTIPFVRVSKPFARKHGPDVAILAAEFCYWSKLMNRKIAVSANSGYFFFEESKIKKATGLSMYRQRKARKKLIELDILHVKAEKKDIPPKNQYHIDEANYKFEVKKAYERFIKDDSTEIIDDMNDDILDEDL